MSAISWVSSGFFVFLVVAGVSLFLWEDNQQGSDSLKVLCDICILDYSSDRCILDH